MGWGEAVAEGKTRSAGLGRGKGSSSTPRWSVRAQGRTSVDAKALRDGGRTAITPETV